MRIPIVVGVVVLLGVVASSHAQERRRMRYSIPEDIEIPPSVAAALADVIGEHDRLHALGLRRNTDRFEATDENRAELARIVESFRSIFESRTYAPIDGSTLRLFEFAKDAFARALAADEEILPSDLLVLLDERLLRAPPIVESAGYAEDLAAMRADERVPQRAVPEIGNPSARFLLWGALQTRKFWERRDGTETKAAFLSALIAAGDAHQLAAETMIEAIAPPENVSGMERTAAGPFEDLCGRVGFTDEHLEQVDAILASIDDERRRRGGDEDEERTTLDGETGRLKRVVSDDAYRHPWAAQLRAQIEAELHPVEPISHRKNGTLAEQIAWWRAFAEKASYVDFEAAVLQHLEEIFSRSVLDGEMKHPNDDRIRQLLALAMSKGASSLSEAYAGQGLDEGEVRELRELWSQRDADSIGVSQFALELMATKGAGPHRRDLMATLIDKVGAALPEANREMWTEELTRGAWNRFSESDPEGALALLTERNDGDPLANRAPRYGVSPVIQNLTIRALQGTPVEGSREVLKNLAINGSVFDRSAVSANSEVLGEDARVAFDRMLADLVDDGKGFSNFEVQWLKSGFVNGLQGRSERRDEAWIVELLHRSFGFEDPDGDGIGTYTGRNLWSDPDPAKWLATDPNQQRWLVKKLPEKVFRELVAQGRLPEELAALR